MKQIKDNIEAYEEETPQEENTDNQETFQSPLDINLFFDVNLKVSVEVGRVKKMLFDVMKLKEGDIIKLDKNTEDYIDIYVNHQKFAIGELVIVNDKYAVRVVDLAG